MSIGKNLKKEDILGDIIEIMSPSIQKSLDIEQKNKKKTEKTSLSKDQHYYQQNKKLIRQKARNRYKEKMRDRNNRKRKKGGVFSKGIFAEPYSPFQDSVKPLIIIYEA
mgnify:CR=1 FL=1